MIITSDYHTHTIFSHGKGSVEDNVKAAISAGLKEIAIADHSVGHLAYGVRDVEKYLREIERIADKYSDRIVVKKGLELNILSDEGELDIPKGYADCFDILLFGYHKFCSFRGLGGKLHYLLPKSDSDAAVQRNTQAYINALNRYKIDIISHPGYGLPIDKMQVAQAALRRGTFLEINNKHPEFTAEELSQCAKMGIRFSVNSDAHSPEKIGIFGNALEKVKAAGLSCNQVLNAEGE